MNDIALVSEKAPKTSYIVAQRIVKSKKQHTIREELILPAAVECEVMLGAKEIKNIKVRFVFQLCKEMGVDHDTLLFHFRVKQQVV